MATYTLQDLQTKREALDAIKAVTTDADELRSIAARRAHLTRKISKFQTAPEATWAPAAPVTQDPDAPLAPADILAETLAMLAKFGKSNWTAKMSPIATKMYGCADFGKSEIRISAKLAAVNPASRTRNTIAHEVAHVIAGYKAGHGPEWKQACRLTGAEPKACYSGGDVQAVAARFSGDCNACGTTVTTRNKAPKSRGYHYHPAKACSAYGLSNYDRRVVWTDTETGLVVKN